MTDVFQSTEMYSKRKLYKRINKLVHLDIFCIFIISWQKTTNFISFCDSVVTQTNVLFYNALSFLT